MKAIIHIGTEKTGTTSIQDTLEKNEETLKKEGYYYPKVFYNNNHPKIYIYSMEDDTNDIRKKRFKTETKKETENFREKFTKDIDAELNKNKIKTVFIVNEHLSRLRKKSELVRLKNFLEKRFDEIEIILYIRRQDKLMRSMYSTIIKIGGIRQNVFPEYKDKTNEDFDIFNYERIIKLWSSVFTNKKINIRHFEKEKLHKQDVVIDFLKKSGFINYNAIKIQRSNESLSHEAIILLRELNKKTNKKYRENIGLICGRLFPGKGMPVTKEQAKQFLEHFKDSNRNVAKEHFNCEELFEDIEEEEFPPEEVVNQNLDIEIAIEMFAKIYSEKTKQMRNQINQLSKK